MSQQIDTNEESGDTMDDYMEFLHQLSQIVPPKPIAWRLKQYGAVISNEDQLQQYLNLGYVISEFLYSKDQVTDAFQRGYEEGYNDGYNSATKYLPPPMTDERLDEIESEILVNGGSYKESLSQVCDISSQQEIVGPSGDKLSDFRDDQWWVHELNIALSDGTPDQRRALAVVRNLLATVKTHLTTQNL